MRKITKSTIKIDEQDFNSCPGREVIVREIAKAGLDQYLTYVDINPEFAKYWENDEATLVAEVTFPENPTKKDMAKALEIGSLARDFGADEYINRVVNGRHIIRMWWD